MNRKVRDMNCDICSLSFANRSNLNRHLKRKHNFDVVSLYKRHYICDICKQSFGTKHEIKTHVPTHNQKKSDRIRCAECTSTFKNYKTYRKHLADDHKIELEEHSQTFDDIKSFYEWKEKIEKQDCVSFIQNTSSNKSPVCKITYFVCHRSYQANLKQNRSRRLKGKGSVKIGYACPATIILREYSHDIVVNFCFIHLHPCELGHLQLSSSERSYIAEKLSVGVTPQQILKDIRNSTTGVKQRLHLLERKDIHNIIRDFKILKKNHTNDVSSVKSFVESFNPDEPDNNPIIFLKQQGDLPPEEYKTLVDEEDFVLVICSTFERDMIKEFGQNIICVDTTHSLNDNHYLLHNILTVDEFGQGVPVAHCFSNKKNTSVYKIFFFEIMKSVGLVNPKVLMTDDDPSIINAWSAVMGVPDKHLLCIWHILKNWRENLLKIKCDKKRKIVYRTLKALYSTLNANLFERTLASICEDLLSDGDTVEFGNYFVSNYVPKKEKWAYAHRKYAGINTNNYIKSLHKQFKYCIVDGQSCRRLDDAINAVLDMIQNKFFERTIRLEKNKCSTRMRKIEAAHAEMKFVDQDSIRSLSQTKFMVPSAAGDDRQYCVEKMDCLDNCSCKLRCQECNICVHQYRCSCPNSAIAFNICRHIHAVHFFKFATNDRGEGEGEDDNDNDGYEIIDCIVSEDVPNSNTFTVLPSAAFLASINSVVDNVDIVRKLHIYMGLYQKHKDAISEDLKYRLNSSLDESISLIMDAGKSAFNKVVER